MKIFVYKGALDESDIESIAIEKAKEICPDESEYITKYIDTQSDETLRSSLYYSSQLLEDMLDCNAVYFGKGWNKYTILQILHGGATEFGVPILSE